VPYLSRATPEIVEPRALPKNKNAANNGYKYVGIKEFMSKETYNELNSRGFRIQEMELTTGYASGIKFIIDWTDEQTPINYLEVINSFFKY
jgi:hypothetical protein